MYKILLLHQYDCMICQAGRSVELPYNDVQQRVTQLVVMNTEILLKSPFPIK
jgi:hypothetical protein